MYFLLRASTVSWSHTSTLQPHCTAWSIFCYSRISKRNKHLFAQSLIIEPLTNKSDGKNPVTERLCK